MMCVDIKRNKYLLSIRKKIRQENNNNNNNKKMTSYPALGIEP